MNVISYSLFGSHPKYCIGMIKNAALAKRFFPEFSIRVYHDSTVPELVLQQLKALNCTLVDMTGSPLQQAKPFWRLLIIDDPGVKIFLIRDADSRLNKRDRALYDQWFNQKNEKFYVIHDHPSHEVPILCGLFGGYAKPMQMAEKIQAWPSWDTYGDDEKFLAEVIFPLIQNSVRDFCYDQIDIPRFCFEFLGEPLTQNDMPNLAFRFAFIKEPIKKWLHRIGIKIGCIGAE